jgi:hypothetical protein|tara:strand:- start:667 stop:1011 length:345 start_codon:yes stop_codon:yes gene_type:complete
MKLLEYVERVQEDFKGKNETKFFYFMRNQLAHYHWHYRDNHSLEAKHTMFHLQNIHHSDNFKIVIAYYWYHFIVPAYDASFSLKDKATFKQDAHDQVNDFISPKPKKGLLANLN